MLLFLLINVSVIGLPAGKDYNVVNISKCYDNYNVKIRGEGNVTTGYSFPGCTKYKTEKNNDFWNCTCTTNSSKLILKTNNNVENNYDVVVEYFISPDRSLSDKRTDEFNNLVFEIPEPEKEPFSLPKLESANVILIILGLVFILAILGIIWVGRWVFTSDENQLDSVKKVEPKKEVVQLDEDDDLINKYSSK